jgi:hypothetical protein
VTGGDPIRSVVARLRLLLRACLLARGAGRLACAGAAGCLAAYGLDRALELPLTGRAVMLAAALIAAVLLATRCLVRPLVQDLADEALVIELERRGAGPDGLLSTAFAISGAEADSPFGAGVLTRARMACRGLAARRMVRWRVPCLWGLAGAGALVGLVGVSAALPRSAGVFLERNLLLRDVAWPRRTRLAILSAPRFAVSGEAAAIRVRALGAVPRSVQVMTRSVPGGEWTAVPMAGDGEGAFTARIGPLTQHTLFSVQGGDASAVDGSIAVVRRPEVARARLTVSPPAYVSATPVELAWQSGTFDIPQGSRVTILLQATSPLASAAARTAQGEALAPDWLDPDRRGIGLALQVSADTVLSVDLVDERGVRSSEPFRVRIRAVPDEPPQLRLAARGVGELVTPVARLPVSVEARDDYGIGEVRVVVRTDGGAAREAVLPVADGAGRQLVSGDVTVVASDLAAAPGQRLLVEGVAADTKAPGGPQLGLSTELVFRVVSTAELLNALLVTQLDLRRDLEHQAELQRALLADLAAGNLAPTPLAARQRGLAPVLARIGGGYADVLDQMLHNGILDPPAHALRTAAIPAALTGLAESGGAVEQAADGILETRAPAAAESAMRQTLAGMERVRSAMLLLEGYSSIVASVREVSTEQEAILRRTEEREASALEGVFGP